MSREPHIRWFLSDATKRACDVVLATISLIALAPVLIVVALLIKLDSRGPLFFRQIRIGRRGILFTIFKFRTMIVNAAEIGAGLETYKGDPRVTRIGAVLRKYRLDELPQLLNVLSGDMSLVGPRPLLPEYLSEWSNRDKRRLEVKPGMTGWQQVNGGSLNSWAERINLDLWYVDHRSAVLDLLVLLRTISVVAKADTLYGGDGWQRSGHPPTDRRTKSGGLGQ
jgi:lipopolysaccharide/colanic/teichoic acid biosynthesis glycosyltransferase